MASQWNPQPHTPYEGQVIEQMRILLKDGGIPISLRYDWEQRVGGADVAVRNTFRREHAFTGVPRVKSREGDVKCVIYRPGVNDKQYFALLRLINEEATFKEGAIVLPDGTYASIDAPVVTRAELQLFANGKLQTEDQAAHNKVLRILAEDNVQLIRDNHKIAREVTGNELVMRVYSDTTKDAETMRLWVAGSVNGSLSGNVNGLINLDEDGRLVAVKPEALVAAMGWPKESLETILTHLEEFRKVA